MNKLPNTDVTAELKFPNREEANHFATMYTRKTLMGHIVSGSTVKIFNVTDEIKQWVSDYITSLEQQ